MSEMGEAQVVLDESDLKARLLNRLRRDGRISHKSVIANEFRIGDSGVRADLAILGRNFMGIEVKSARDTLRRLTSQTTSYVATFDLTILLVADRHLESIPRSLQGIEIWAADRSGELRRVHAPQHHIRRKQTELRALLNVRQVRKLEKLGAAEACSEGRMTRHIFEEGFRNSYQHNSDSFWTNVYGRTIERYDLATLSNYRERRAMAKQKVDARIDAFRSWKT